MDEPTFTGVNRQSFRPTPCPACGKQRELGWMDVGNLENQDQWVPTQKCRNRECSEFRDPTSLGG